MGWLRSLLANGAGRTALLLTALNATVAIADVWLPLWLLDEGVAVMSAAIMTRCVGFLLAELRRVNAENAALRAAA